MEKNWVNQYIADHLPHLLAGENVSSRAVPEYENGIEIQQNGHALLLYSCTEKKQVFEILTVGSCHGEELLRNSYQYDEVGQCWQTI